MRVLVWVGMLVLLNACNDSLENTIGFQGITSSFGKVYFIDTLSVVSSTVLVDSIDTSSSGRVLVGAYDDEYFGKISSASYMQFGLQLSDETGGVVSWSVSDEATFDRVELVLYYDDYYYGDTTVNQSIDVFQLSESITGRLVGDYDFVDTTPSYFYSYAGLYNVSETAYNATPLASYSYRPYPGSGDSLEIRLDNKFGSIWLEYKKSNDLIIRDNASFINEFKGLMISNSTLSANNTVVGFDTEKTRIRLWYWDQENDIRINKYQDFPLYQTELQYNKIDTDRSGTQLTSLVAGVPLPASATNGEVFMQGGSGIFTKIDFPSLNGLSNVAILQAELILTPLTESLSGNVPLPPTLSVYLVDNNNIPIDALIDSETNLILTSARYYDSDFHLKNYYSINMTTYMTALINDSAGDYHLMIGVTNPGTGGTVDRTVLGTSKDHIQLKVYYTKLNTDSQ
ncbi:MAG: DUF4270 family protein [Cyclobacteriaceae bacterium]